MSQRVCRSRLPGKVNAAPPLECECDEGYPQQLQSVEWIQRMHARKEVQGKMLFDDGFSGALWP